MKLRWTDILPAGGIWHIVRSELRGRFCPCHDHDFYELFWVEAGRGVHRLNDQRFPLEPGQLWMIRPTDRHQPLGDDRLGLTIVNLAMAGGHIRSLRGRYRGQVGWPWAESAESMHQLNGTQMADMRRCADRLAGMDQRPVVLDGVLLQILDTLETDKPDAMVRQVGRDVAGPDHKAPAWLSDALVVFDASKSMKMGPGEFARLAHRTPEHVNRTMQAAFGCDTTTRLNAHRMRRAGSLLRMSARPIVDVAQACGFGSLTHFYRCFAEHYRTTPRRYRLAAKRPVSRRS